MVPWRASPDGYVTDDVLAWYERFAEGQPGAIVVEATGIRDVASGPLLRIGDDRFVPGLKDLVKIVKRASDGKTRLFIQLIDFLAIRRRPSPDAYFGKYLTITNRHRAALDLKGADDAIVRERLLQLDGNALEAVLNARELESLRLGYRERVSDTHLEHVQDLPKTLPGLFSAAALRARKAGFDGVELHYAHAYTMASFLSALNDRDDGYGKSRDGRVRLPLEVYSAVRNQVGADFPVGCRFLSDDCIPDGSTIADAAWFAVKFAEAGMDFLSLSRGGKFEDAKAPKVGTAVYPYTGPSGYECMPGHISDEAGPFGRNLRPAEIIRRDVRKAGFATPLVVAGGIHGFEQAEAILAKGQADIVGFARQALADPDWFRKVSTGKGAEVRLCEYTNYCEGLDQKHKQVTCQLWDRQALDAADCRPSSDGKRRLEAPRKF
jgi:2,4-dienoyl-CoA reductase-like NADH-dependent reductase (Old Yellow Enzyme family)